MTKKSNKKAVQNELLKNPFCRLIELKEGTEAVVHSNLTKKGWFNYQDLKKSTLFLIDLIQASSLIKQKSQDAQVSFLQNQLRLILVLDQLEDLQARLEEAYRGLECI